MSEPASLLATTEVVNIRINWKLIETCNPMARYPENTFTGPGMEEQELRVADPSPEVEFQRPLQNAWRGGLIALPNVELPMLPSTELGPLNCVWLKTLNASTRKSSDFDSVRGRLLRDRHIVVVRAWAIKEPPLCVARRAERIHAEGGGSRSSCSRWCGDCGSGGADRRCSPVRRCCCYSLRSDWSQSANCLRCWSWLRESRSQSA